MNSSFRFSGRTLHTFWCFLKNIRFTNARKLQTADVLFFSADADKSETVTSGQKFDKYLDPLVCWFESKGYSSTSIAWPGSSYYGLKTWAGALNITWPYLSAWLRDALSRDSRSETHRVLFFMALLETVNPKVIFTIGGTDPLRLAASRLGIPCVEVLHARGYHVSPASWFAARTLPSHTLAFDEVSKNLLDTYCGKKSAVILTRDYWVSHWRGRGEPELKSNRIALPEFRFEPPRTSAPYRILVSLQWGYAGDSERYIGKARKEIFANGLFPDNLLQAIGELAEDAFWLFRLHPVQLNSGRRKYRSQRRYLEQLFSGQKNVEIFNSSRAPLPLLLSGCTHNVTTSSSLCYEAAEFGIPTLTTSSLLLGGEPLQNRFHDLVDEGYVSKVGPEYSSIADWVRDTTLLAPRRVEKDGQPIDDVLDSILKGP